MRSKPTLPQSPVPSRSPVIHCRKYFPRNLNNHRPKDYKKHDREDEQHKHWNHLYGGLRRTLFSPLTTLSSQRI
jgi:hypothetical protein